MPQARPSAAFVRPLNSIVRPQMIDPSETSIIGHWVATDSGVSGDQTCERIQSLVTSHLIELAHSPDGWSTLFRDPTDNRLWQRTFPQSELQGGGPPTLEFIAKGKAMAIFGVEA